MVHESKTTCVRIFVNNLGIFALKTNERSSSNVMDFTINFYFLFVHINEDGCVLSVCVWAPNLTHLRENVFYKVALHCDRCSFFFDAITMTVVGGRIYAIHQVMHGRKERRPFTLTWLCLYNIKRSARKGFGIGSPKNNRYTI